MRMVALAAVALAVVSDARAEFRWPWDPPAHRRGRPAPPAPKPDCAAINEAVRTLGPNLQRALKSSTRRQRAVIAECMTDAQRQPD